MDLRGERDFKKLWHRSHHVLWKWNCEFNSGEARSVKLAPVYSLEFQVSYPKRDNEF